MTVVSTIIPCYNSSHYLSETIQSVLQQKGDFRKEIICVDNGSTDDTLELLKTLAKETPELIISSEKKQGASYARAKGLSICTGDYIQFLDSDDVILPSKFKNQIEAIKSNHLDWVISDRSVMNQDLSETIATHSYQHILSSPLNVAISEVITSGNPLYKKSALEQVGGYTPELVVGQDWDLHIKLILADLRFGYLGGDYFHSRRLDGSLSSNWIKVSNTLCGLIKHYKSAFVQNGVSDMQEAMKKIHQTYLLSLVHGNELNKEWLDELKFWLQQSPASAESLGKLGFLYKLFGLKFYLQIRRRLKR